MGAIDRLGVGVGALALLVAVAGTSRAEELDCLIEPTERVELGTAVTAVIERVLVDRGDVVAKGDPLVELESALQRANVAVEEVRASAEGPLKRNSARLHYANSVLARQEELKRSNVVSIQELEEARSNREVALAEIQDAEEQKQLARTELERARAALELRTLHSPIDGVVVKRLLGPGELVDSEEILELAQIDPLRVEVFAPARLYGSVSKGMGTQVLPEEPIGGSYEATVTVVDPVIDAASGTFGVRLELPNPDHAIPAGLKCRVRFGDEASRDAAGRESTGATAQR